MTNWATYNLLNRNIEAESFIQAGLVELWSPSTKRYYLSPAYLLNNFLEWWGLIKLSPLACIKKAGIKALSTWSIGFKWSILNLALFFIVLLTKYSPKEVKKFGILENYLANSSATLRSVANGLSRIMPAMDGSRSACNKAVMAPILLPHNPF